jgi:hypothetical protein
MELLVIKTGSEYIRIKKEACLAVGMDKASVFPLDQLALVKKQLADMRAGLFPDAAIHKLSITETLLTDS